MNKLCPGPIWRCSLYPTLCPRAAIVVLVGHPTVLHNYIRSKITCLGNRIPPGGSREGILPDIQLSLATLMTSPPYCLTEHAPLSVCYNLYTSMYAYICYTCNLYTCKTTNLHTIKIVNSKILGLSQYFSCLSTSIQNASYRAKASSRKFLPSGSFRSTARHKSLEGTINIGDHTD